MMQCSKTHNPGRFASQREQARRQLVAVSRFRAETAEIEIGFRLLLHQGKDPVPPGFRVRAHREEDPVVELLGRVQPAIVVVMRSAAFQRLGADCHFDMAHARSALWSRSGFAAKRRG
jgi:hypothetical protein